MITTILSSIIMFVLGLGMAFAGGRRDGYRTAKHETAMREEKTNQKRKELRDEVETDTSTAGADAALDSLRNDWAD